MSATNHTQHGLVQYILDDEPMMDDTNGDNLIIEQGLQKIDEHIADHNNPHNTTKDKIGLGNVDNTSDTDKPISTAQQAALNALDAQKIDKTAIVDNLTTGGTDKVLSAEQGKILKADVDANKAQLDALPAALAGKVSVSDIVNDLVTGGDNKPLSATQGVALQRDKADQPYQLHTQTDGGFHIEDSAGGLVADCVIGGNGWQSKVGKNLTDLASSHLEQSYSLASSITANSAVVTNNQPAEGVARVSYCRFRQDPLKAGVTYTVSCKFERLSGDENVIGKPRLTIHASPGPSFGGSVNLGQFFSDSVNKFLTFTVPVETPYIWVSLYSQSVNTTTKEDGSARFYDLQIEKGSTATPYEPYTPDPTPEAPIMPVCLPEGTRVKFIKKNWFDPSVYAALYNPVSDAYEGNANQFHNIKIDVPLNLKQRRFVFAAAVKGTATNIRVEILYSGGVISNGNTVNSSSDFLQSVVVSDPSKIAEKIYISYGNYGNISAKHMQIELGSTATPYEPYTNPTTLVTPCDLWATSDGLYKDNWNPLTGNASADCDVYTVTGTENWRAQSATEGTFIFTLYTSDGFPQYRPSAVFCTHYTGQSPATQNTTAYNKGNLTCCVRSGTVDRFYIRDDTYPGGGVGAFKTYLAAQYAAGTPVKICFAKATTITTQYPPQPITLPKGIVNVVVELPEGGGVLPSSMSMLYRQDLKAFIQGIVNSIYDTLATHITSLAVRVTQLETAGGD